MNEQEASMIMAHIFSAVKYLHKNGIVHRNLRPETIIFKSDDSLSDIRLIDFSSAIETKDIEVGEDVFFEKVVKFPPYY